MVCPLLSSILFDFPFSHPTRGMFPLLSSILSHPPRRMCSLLSSIFFDLRSPIYLEGCVLYSLLQYSLWPPFLPSTWRDVSFTLFDSLWPPSPIHLEGCALYSLRFSLTSSPHSSWWNCPFTLLDSLWPPLLIHLDGIVLLLSSILFDLLSSFILMELSFYSFRFSLTSSPHPSWWNCPFTLFDSLWPPSPIHLLEGSVLYSLRFSPIHLEGCALYSLRFSLTSLLLHLEGCVLYSLQLSLTTPLIYLEGCVHYCLRSLWPFLLIHLEAFVLYSIRLSFTSPSHPSWGMCPLHSSFLFDLPSSIHLEGCVLYSLRFSLTPLSPIHLEGCALYFFRFFLTSLLPSN